VSVQQRHGFRKFVGWMIVLGVIVVGAGPPALAYAAQSIVALPPIPPNPQDSIVYASDRTTVIGVIPASENRHDLDPKTEIPMVMKQAIIASEDKDFYAENGVSYTGMYRSFLTIAKSLTHGSLQLASGSTLEQQYAKNALLTLDQTGGRKFKDMGMAQHLDREYTKDQVLGLYLNTVFFCRNAYGIDAAARAYFGHGATKLSVAEAATLAAMVQQPCNYAMAKYAPNLLRRRNSHVLATMQELGNIAPEEAALVAKQPLGFIKEKAAAKASMPLEPYITDLVRQYLVKTRGEAAVAQGGFRIYTTINWKLQQAAKRSLVSNLSSPKLVAAMAVISPKTGAVVALANSTSHAKLQFDIAVQGTRQVGSAMKPFVLADAISKGVSTDAVLPAPAYALIGGTKVYNDDRTAHGYLDMTRALATSNNPWHMQLINGTQADPGSPSNTFPIPNDPVSPQSVADLAHKLGIDDTLYGTAELMSGDAPPHLDAVPELALGTSSITPLQMASAYGTWANNGNHAESFIVSSITAADGTVLYQHQVQTTPVMDAEATAQLTKVMQSVIHSPSGTANRADFGRPAAGKTGTTLFDAWFAGYTPDYVAAAWTGYLDNRNLTVSGRQVFGGSSAAIMWRDFMEVAHRNIAVHYFSAPSSNGTNMLAPPPPAPTTPADTPTPDQPPDTITTPDPTVTAEPTTVPPETTPTQEPGNQAPPSETPLPTSTVTD